MFRSLIVLVPCLVLAVGCGSQASETSVVDEAAATALNTTCPIMGGEVEPDGGSVEYAGHTIGFCCPGCVDDWNALDDAGKVAALAEAGTELPR